MSEKPNDCHLVTLAHHIYHLIFSLIFIHLYSVFFVEKKLFTKLLSALELLSVLFKSPFSWIEIWISEIYINFKFHKQCCCSWVGGRRMVQRWKWKKTPLWGINLQPESKLSRGVNLFRRIPLQRRIFSNYQIGLLHHTEKFSFRRCWNNSWRWCGESKYSLFLNRGRNSTGSGLCLAGMLLFRVCRASFYTHAKSKSGYFSTPRYRNPPSLSSPNFLNPPQLGRTPYWDRYVTVMPALFKCKQSEAPALTLSYTPQLFWKAFGTSFTPLPSPSPSVFLCKTWWVYLYVWFCTLLTGRISVCMIFIFPCSFLWFWVTCRRFHRSPPSSCPLSSANNYFQQVRRESSQEPRVKCRVKTRLG